MGAQTITLNIQGKNTTKTHMQEILATQNRRTQTALDWFADQLGIKSGSLLEQAKRIELEQSKIENTGADINRYILIKNGEQICAPKKVVELANYLQKNKNRVVSKEEILRKVWGREEFITKTTVTVHICKIRKILGKDCIIIAKGVGYRWNL